jgi:UDP-N-acetylglucosamine--N-acetylmuramyl-(pentapeptide) pyrophosphoryl-undecaprenol N-acetylglucosamine transferase
MVREHVRSNPIRARKAISQDVPRVLIAGGGTGGHAIPALCVADSLHAKGAAVEFVGSTTGIEANLVPKAGYTLHALPLVGLSGGPVKRVRAGLLFLKALRRCRAILQIHRPGVVLGVGGYASAPAVLAATALKIPTFLHEQNAVPGRVNRFASRFTREIFVTFPAAAEFLRDTFPVGMPTRREFFEASREEALRKLGLEPPVVLIFGGSGGALKLNLAAAKAFRGATPYTIFHISGRRDFGRLSTDNPRHKIVEYENELWHPLAAAEVVVMRAGAGSLFDVAAAGKAAIVVPYPYATGDHQIHNARYFTENGAAELLRDNEVNAETLRSLVERLLSEETRREMLANNMRTLATPKAADEVAARLLAAAKNQKGKLL